MKQMKLIMILAMLLPIAASAQEERIDTVIPKFLSNGYFFRERHAAQVSHSQGYSPRTGSQRRPVPKRS